MVLMLGGTHRRLYGGEPPMRPFYMDSIITSSPFYRRPPMNSETTRGALESNPAISSMYGLPGSTSVE